MKATRPGTRFLAYEEESVAFYILMMATSDPARTWQFLRVNNRISWVGFQYFADLLAHATNSNT